MNTPNLYTDSHIWIILLHIQCSTRIRFWGPFAVVDGDKASSVLKYCIQNANISMDVYLSQNKIREAFQLNAMHQ